MMPASVFAADSVAYIDQNGKTQQCTDYIPISAYSGGQLPMWLVVDQDTTLDDHLEIAEGLNLILVNGKTLTARKGISVNEGATLNIYGQSGNTANWSPMRAKSASAQASAEITIMPAGRSRSTAASSFPMAVPMLPASAAATNRTTET